MAIVLIGMNTRERKFRGKTTTDMQEFIPAGQDMQQEEEFLSLATSAFEASHRALYKQVHIEVERLDRLNGLLGMVENELQSVTPEKLKDLDAMQKMDLLYSLRNSSNNSINLLSFMAKSSTNTRTIAGILKGLKNDTK